MPEAEPLIMISTGGTGGHVLAGLAVVKCFDSSPVKLVWVGAPTDLEATLVPAAGMAFEATAMQGVRGKRWFSLLALPWRLGFALLRALYLVRKYHPSLVLCMGGFAAIPAGFIAAALGIPLIVHEQNAIAGLANRWLARFSRRTLLGFPETFVTPPGKHSQRRYAGEYVGNPVREKINSLPEPQERLRGRNGILRLLVIGGSQGCAFFNRVVPAAISLMQPTLRPHVKHQTGMNKLDDACQEMRRNVVELELFEFSNEMSTLYAWADLVLCRAGALSVAELTAVGIAAILVPYPFSVDRHQHANAQYLSEAGAACIVEEAHLTPRQLASLLQRFTQARGELLKMADAAKKLACPRAAQDIMRVCLEEMYT